MAQKSQQGPSGRKLTCCGPCQGKGMCSVGINCCLECHFAWEEKHLARFLPPSVRNRLISEHRELADTGFPPDAVRAHSVWEESVFRRYCPGGLAHQVAVDHRAAERGQLRSRKAG